MSIDFKNFPVGRSFVEIPPEVLAVHSAFQDHAPNHDLVLAGGCVRAWLLGHKPKDYDMATSAKPQTVKEVLKKAKIKCYAKGEAFGVISAIFEYSDRENFEIEIATFRKDGKYEDGRRPKNVVYSNMQEDAQRRDFTINAMFYNLEKGSVIDFVGGSEDIEDKIVRCVGSPWARFEEDKLRCMRFVRFSAMVNGGRTEDMDVEHKTAIAYFASKKLPGVSPERIREEFLKGLMTCKDPQLYMQALHELHLLEVAFPDLDLHTSEFLGTKHPYHQIAFLLQKNTWKDARDKLKGLTYAKEEFIKVAYLVALQDLHLYKIYEDPTIPYRLKQCHDRYNINMSREEHLVWAKRMIIGTYVMEDYCDFEITRKMEDVPGTDKLEGKAIQEAMKNYDINRFMQKYRELGS